MACKTTNITPEVVYNLIKNKLPMKPDPGQIMEQTEIKLDIMKDHLTLSDEKYKFDDLDIKNRVSDKIGRKLADNPDREILRNTGADTKKIIYAVLNKKLNNEGNISSVQATTKFSNEHTRVIVKGVEKFIDEILEKYPDSKIRIAQPIVDPKKDTATTVDLLVLHPDNSANIYAFHTFSGEQMYASSVEMYHKQQVERRDILLNTIGVTSIRESRIIPIQVKNKMKRKVFNPSLRMMVNREVGDRLTPEIYSVSMLGGSIEENQEYLEHIPIAFEKTGMKGVDEWVKKQYNVIETLKQKVEKEPNYEKRTILWDKIAHLEAGIRTFLRKVDFSIIDNYINKKLGPAITSKIQDQEFRMSDGAFAQLSEWELELSAYSNIVEDFRNFSVDNMTEEEKLSFLKAIYEVKRTSDILISEINLAKKELVEARAGKIDNIQNAPNWFERQFGRLSSFANPLFKRFSQLVRANYEATEIEVGEDMNKVFSAQEKMWNWAKDTGKNRNDLVNIFVNKDTGNIYGKISKEGVEELNSLRDKKNISRMKEVYEIKEGWLRVFETIKAQKLDQYREMYFSEDEARMQLDVQIAMEEWLKQWDLENYDSAWTNPKLLSKLKLKDSFIQQYKSKEFAYIESIPELKEYYDTYTSLMHKYLDYTGLTHGDSKLSSNFIPNIRKQVNEHLSNWDIKDGIAETFNFNIREDDYGIGIENPDGTTKQTVPVLFTNPISIDQKSMDLTRSLLLFGKMAVNYKGIKKMEDEVIAMKDLMSTIEYKSKSTSGSPVNNFMRELKTTKDINSTQQAVFNSFIDYYIYGISTREKGVTVGNVNTTKVAKDLLNLTRRNALGLNVISGFAGGAASKINEYIASFKDGILTRESHKKATDALLSKDRGKNLALFRSIGLYSEDILQRQKSSKYFQDFRKWVNDRMLYSPFRLADEYVDQHIVISASFNYGLDENGNIKRLKNLPEGTKSINDLFTYNQETGEYSFNGLNIQETDAFLRRFRRIAQEAQYGIKGSIQEDDRRAYENTLAGQILMAFKNFMPGLISERAKRFSYNEVTDTADIGRYTAYFNNYIKKINDVGEDGKLIQDTWGAVFKNIVSSSRILVYNFTNNQEVDGVSSRLVNLDRAKIAYKEFLLDYPDMKDKVSLQQFIDAQEGQLKAMAIELRIILGLVLGAMVLGMECDDDEPLYSELYLDIPYKMLKKSLSELQYWYSFEELMKLQKNPIVIIRPITQGIKTFTNTFDELRDWSIGENSSQDKTPWGYYGRTFISGVNQASRLFPIYDQDKRILD